MISPSLTLRLTYLLCWCMLMGSQLGAQEVYPYSCQDGNYGLADVNGQLIEGCQYSYYRPSITGTPHYTFRQGDNYTVIAFSGDKCPYTFSRQPTIQLIHYIDNGVDELFDSIYVIHTPQQLVLHHPRQTDKFYLSLSREQAGFSDRFATDTYAPISPDFYYGITKIHPAPGKTNFLDHTGKLLLDTPTTNGKIVDGQRFAQRHDNGLFSLNDYTGKAFTDPRYYNLLASARAGYYVANMPDYFIPNKNYPAKAALLDDQGRILIDTLYELLMPIGSQYLIAGSKGAAGVINYEGQVVIPFEYETLKPAINDHLIAQQQGKYYLIDYQGQAVGEGLAYDQITSTNRQGYYARQGQNASLLDETGNTIYKGNFQIQNHIAKLDYFIIRQGSLQGVIKGDGEVLIPLEYAQIKITGDDNVIIYQNPATSLYGLWDSTGQDILTAKYSDINVRHHPRADGLAYWAKPADDTLYQGFDQSGKQLHKLATLNPKRSQDQYFSVSQQNGAYTYTLPNGRQLENVPYKVDLSAEGPDGTLVHRVRQGQDYYLLDADFFNIIPEGYRMLRKYLDDRHLRYGLVPVYNDYESGVINLQGEWVVEPGPYGYSILSPSFIRRHRGEPRGYSSPEGIDLLFIQDGTIAKESHYDYIYDRFVRGLLIVGKKNQGQAFQTIQQGLLDSLGENVLPLRHYEVKIHENRITTRRYLDAQTQEVGMYQLSGAEIFNLPGEKLVYYPEQARCVLTQDGKSGLFTEDGIPLLPVQYNNLRLLKDFIEYITADQYVLAKQDGTVCHRANTSFSYVRNWRNGYRHVFSTNDDVLLFDENMQLIAEYPYKVPTARSYAPHLLFCKSQDNRRTIYINLENGVAYSN